MTLEEAGYSRKPRAGEAVGGVEGEYQQGVRTNKLMGISHICNTTTSTLVHIPHVTLIFKWISIIGRNNKCVGTKHIAISTYICSSWIHMMRGLSSYTTQQPKICWCHDITIMKAKQWRNIKICWYHDISIMKAKNWGNINASLLCKLSFSKHLNSCQQKVQKQTKIYHHELPSSDLTNSILE